MGLHIWKLQVAKREQDRRQLYATTYRCLTELVLSILFRLRQNWRIFVSKIRETTCLEYIEGIIGNAIALLVAAPIYRAYTSEGEGHR